MTTHSYHDSTLEVGLVDGCHRCTEHAVHPFASLDDTHIRQIADRVLNGDLPRTENEAIAMRKMQEAFMATKRLESVGITPERITTW